MSLKNIKFPRPIVSDETFEKWLENANDDFKDVLIYGFDSAMRASEIADLTVNQVYLDEISILTGEKQVYNYIDLGIFDTKNKARRTVPVSADLKKVLMRSIKGKDPEDWVFYNKDIKYTKHPIKYAMEVTCDNAKVPYGDKALNKEGEKIGIVFHSL